MHCLTIYSEERIRYLPRSCLPRCSPRPFQVEDVFGLMAIQDGRLSYFCGGYCEGWDDEEEGGEEGVCDVHGSGGWIEVGEIDEVDVKGEGWEVSLDCFGLSHGKEDRDDDLSPAMTSSERGDASSRIIAWSSTYTRLALGHTSTCRT